MYVYFDQLSSNTIIFFDFMHQCFKYFHLKMSFPCYISSEFKTFS